MAAAREKFATQLDAAILSTVRALAASEGRQIRAQVDEVLADLIVKRRQGGPRAHVMAAYQESHERFAPLYRKLAQ